MGRASARGPAHSPWARPALASMIFCGPETSGPGLVNNNFAGCGPGLGLTFPGLGRARAYSESHSCFNIMVKYYRQLSIIIHCNECIVFYTVNVTALCNVSQLLQDRHASQSTIHAILNNGPQQLNVSRANNKEAVRLSVYIWLNIINSLL